jgi:MFS family permease
MLFSVYFVREKLQIPLRIVTWVVVCLIALQSLIWIDALHQQGMISDKWADAAELAVAPGQTVNLTKHLFSRHNEHILPTTRLLTWLDFQYFQGRYRSVQVISAIAWLAAAALSIWQVKKYPSWWGPPLVAAWTINAFGTANAGFAYFFQHHAVWLLLALGTFVVNRSAFWLIPILFLALGSNSNGFLIVPAIAFSYWWIDWKHSKALQVLAGISLAAGLGLIFGPARQTADHWAATLLDLPRFLAYLIGLPFHFAGVPNSVCLLLGIVGLALALWALWLVRTKPRADLPDRQLLSASMVIAFTSWSTFGLATLLLISLGRAGQTDQIPFDGKYFPYAALVWMSTLLLLGTFHRIRRPVMYAVLASILLMFPMLQQPTLWHARWFRQSTEPLMAAAQFGSESPTITQFGGQADASLVAKLYLRRHNSFSYPDLRDLGWDLSQRLENRGSCRDGATEGAEQIIAGYRLHGQGSDLEISAKDRRVLITTVAPVPLVVGWGTFVSPNVEPQWPFAHLWPPELVTWEAYIDGRTRGSVQAWAVSLKQRTACSLGSSVVLP